MSPAALAILLVSVFLAASALIEAVRRMAIAWHLYDVPNTRSSHSQPTPRAGGVGIVAGVLGGMTVAASVGMMPAAPSSWTFIGAGLAVALVSLVDDFRPLPPHVRFLVHSAAAVAVTTACGPIREIDLGGAALSLGPAAYPLTWIWIVGVTNAFNFMDGIDGIAGAQALVAAAGWILLSPDRSIVVVSALTATAAAAFLLRNVPPASIFMGDVGSAFLGFAFASIPLLASENRSLVIPAVLLLWPFLFDTTFTLFRRLRRGENILLAHRSHLYQRLNIAGWSHGAVTSFYALLALVGVAAAVAFNRVTAAVLLPAAAGLALWQVVRSAER
ncbi:MAG TPA: glycosyltransferase family 4 protein [Thermoanaerobaculia bacterium]|nr:glycosyltransferase family 4 protein [Thermoanaerobaculia bacterium]